MFWRLTPAPHSPSVAQAGSALLRGPDRFAAKPGAPLKGDKGEGQDRQIQARQTGGRAEAGGGVNDALDVNSLSQQDK
jgi:hypothetical protein